MLSLLRKIESYFELKTPIIYTHVAFFLFLHVCGFYGLYLVPSAKLATVIVAYIFMQLSHLGVTIGMHRMWAHRSFKAKLPFRTFLLFCYLLGGQYSIARWAIDHRTHHLHSDTDADPHSIKRGVFYSHIGWVLMERHPDSVAKSRRVDISDVLRDPLVRFQQRHFYLLLVLVNGVFPTSLAYYVIGETLLNSIFVMYFLRHMVSLNIVFLLNSMAHYLGNKPYMKNTEARNHPLISIMSFGEGWHNYHHAFPYDYRIGELGQRLLWGARVIEWAAWAGQATHLRSASPREIQRALDKTRAATPHALDATATLSHGQDGARRVVVSGSL